MIPWDNIICVLNGNIVILFSYIVRIMDEIGFSYKWINQVNERNCKENIARTFLQRLKDIYSQNELGYLNKDENIDSGIFNSTRINITN